MNDKPNQAKNPALKIQAAREKVMFGEAANSEPQRAEIIMPGKDKSYSQVSKGGIASRQAPARKPGVKPAPAKNKPATKQVKKTKTKKKALSAEQLSKDLA